MEQNKVLMVIVSVAIFFAAVIGVGVALLYPRTDGGEGGEMIGAVEEFDPIEYIRRPEPAPIAESEGAEDRSMVVYGSEEESVEPGAERTLVHPEEVIDPREVTISERPAVAERTEPARDERGSTDTVPEAGRAVPVARDTQPGSAARTPQPQSRRVRVTEYWIQLIASPSRDRVEQARIVLSDYSLGGRITTRDVEGTLFYRLRVGPYESAEEAETFLQWITAIDGFESAYVSEEYPLRTVNG